MAFIMEDTSTIIHDKTVAEAAVSPIKRNKGHKSCRGKGEGTLKLRGGIYHAQWVVNGKTYYRSTSTGNKREAETRLKEFVAPFRVKDEKAILENISVRLQGVQGEIDKAEAQKPALAISAAWEAYKKAPNRPDSGERTLTGYEGQYGILEKWINVHHPAITELRHVTQAVADEFIGYIGSTRSANTYNKYKTFFSCMWEVLKKVGRLTINPWTNIRRKVDVGHSRRELTVEELHRVVGSATGEMRTLFAIGIYTGLRLGDCALLEWGQVDLARGLISVIPRKTARHAHGKSTVIPINPALLRVLRECESRKGYVLPQTAELYKKRADGVTYRIQKLFHDCGIKTVSEKTSGMYNRVDVGFHSLRHTFVSLSGNAGVPLAFVQAIVGHTNPAMTAHYFHKDENALKSATAAIPDVIDIKDAVVEPCATLGSASPVGGNIDEFKSIIGRMDDAERHVAFDYFKQLMVECQPTESEELYDGK